MKNILLILTIVIGAATAQTAQTAQAQTPQAATGNPVLESVTITGIEESALSEALRTAIRALSGQTYDQRGADALSARIETEVPGVVAAARTQPGSAAGRARLVFVVARTSVENAAADSNVNSQYIVESVEIKGLIRAQYSEPLYEEMQKMVGQRLDNKLTEDLRSRLSVEVRGQYFVSQKIERGSQPQQVKVVFEAERSPWLFRATLGKFVKNVNIGGGNVEVNDPPGKGTVRAVELNGVARNRVSDDLYNQMQAMVGKLTDQLEANHLLERLKGELRDDYDVRLNIRQGSTPQESRIVYAVEKTKWLPSRAPVGGFAYHSKQGMTLICCGEFIGMTTLNAGWDGDTLIERYKGIGFGVESNSLGTRRLGARLGFESFGMQWKPATRVAAVDTTHELYRSRLSLQPSLAFAFSRHFYVTGGADFTELRLEDPQGVGERWEAVHAGVASFRFQSTEIKRGKTKIDAKAGYEIRSGARSVGSDVVFTRHFAEADTTFGYARNTLRLAVSGGKITGDAPLFQRFSLGNTRTLRGWNKYDIAPLGGDRAWHATVEYRYGPLGVFLDQGSVWDAGGENPIRRSVGLMFTGAIGLGWPLQCSRQCGPMFFVNIR